jgi:hypothetical protein
MANPTIDVYIEVNPVGVDKNGTFDPKYVSSLPSKLTAGAKAAFNGKKKKDVAIKNVKTDLCFWEGKKQKPNDKQFSFDANLNSITKEPDGSNFKIGGKVAYSLSAGNSMFGMANGNGKVPGVPAKDIDGAVLDVGNAIIAKGIADDGLPALVEYIKKHP